MGLCVSREPAAVTVDERERDHQSALKPTVSFDHIRPDVAPAAIEKTEKNAVNEVAEVSQKITTAEVLPVAKPESRNDDEPRHSPFDMLVEGSFDVNKHEVTELTEEGLAELYAQVKVNVLEPLQPMDDAMEQGSLDFAGVSSENCMPCDAENKLPQANATAEIKKVPSLPNNSVKRRTMRYERGTINGKSLPYEDIVKLGLAKAGDKPSTAVL